MINALASSLSGMNAAIMRQNISAHNIAHMTSKSLSASTNGRFPNQISNSQSNPMKTDLNQEMVEQVVNKNLLTANARVFKTQNQMLGTLIDCFG